MYGDVDAPDPAVARDEAAREARLCQSDRANPGPLVGIATDIFVPETADADVVAVGGGVLEVGGRGVLSYRLPALAALWYRARFGAQFVLHR